MRLWADEHAQSDGKDRRLDGRVGAPWWACIKEVIEMYDIGEKPGIGGYCCTNCGWSVNLNDASDRLPPCGSCGKGQHTKYNRC